MFRKVFEKLSIKKCQEIEIPYEKGLLGHSDADVLLHAICDALLGALALGDIGKHFPDTDPKYKGADSTVLLKEVYAMIAELGYELSNCDSTIVLEKPKLREHIDSMRAKISELLDCSMDQISVKATTSEKMGFAGRGEGVVAYATVLIQKK